MTHYLIIAKTGNCWITSQSPDNFDNIKTAMPFDTWQDADRAKDIYHTYRPQVSENAAAARDAEIEDLQRELENARADKLRADKFYEQQLEWTRVQKNIINAFHGLLMRIMTTLAVQNLVQNTHRNRNEENQHLVQQIYTEIHHPISHYFTEAWSNTDDIPF